MKKFLLSVATVAMFANFANAEVITLNVSDATDIKGTEHAEVAKGDKDENGEVSQMGNAKHVQPLESLVLGDFDFSFGNAGGKTEPAYYYPMSTNANGKCQLRIYTSNSMTISAPSDMPIGKIVAKDVKNNNKEVVIYSGDLKTEVTFTTTAQVRFEEFTITVGEEGEAPVLGKGDTKENPYSVAEALQYIKDGGSESAEKFVIGYVTSITELSVSYGNATYVLGDKADATEGLDVYRGYYLNGDKFTAEGQLKKGMHVIVKGNLVNFKGNTPQFTTGSQIVSIDASGVEGIVADADEAPVYYNMQGVRVANPENGVFIEVKGNKATKVVL